MSGYATNQAFELVSPPVPLESSRECGIRF
jgi:hypothetical protein